MSDVPLMMMTIIIMTIMIMIMMIIMILITMMSRRHPALGNWLEDPRRMGLGNERTLLTGIKGRCWETTFAAGVF